jgi:hypothetical protein
MERIDQIREEVEALINQAIELLEKNYDMNSLDYPNVAFGTMIELNGALIELEYLNEEGLKTED